MIDSIFKCFERQTCDRNGLSSTLTFVMLPCCRKVTLGRFHLLGDFEKPNLNYSKSCHMPVKKTKKKMIRQEY